MTSQGETVRPTYQCTGFHDIPAQDSRNDGKNKELYFDVDIKIGTGPAQAIPGSNRWTTGESEGFTTSTPVRDTDGEVEGVTTSTSAPAPDDGPPELTKGQGEAAGPQSGIGRFRRGAELVVERRATVVGRRATFRSIAYQATKVHQKQQELIYAAMRGDLDKVKALHQAGVDLLACDKDGRTSLHHAARYGEADVAKYILDNAPPEIIEMKEKLEGQTALHEAASHQRHDICTMLVEANATLTATDSRGETPMQHALKIGNRVLAECLYDGINYLPDDLPDDWRDRDDDVTFTLNLEDDDLLNFSSLLSDGTIKSRAKVPRLHQAAREGNEESIQHILDSVQCDNDKKQKRRRMKIRLMVNSVDDLGLTALHYAAHAHHLEAVKLLLENGADPSAVDKKKRTPLHLAVCNQQIMLIKTRNGTDTFDARVIKCLMEKGPPSHEMYDYLWRTPLEVAAQHGNVRAINEILLHLGIKIDPSQKHASEQDAMHQALVTALKYKKSNVCRWLLNKISYRHEKIKTATWPLHSACLGGQPIMVHKLFESAETADKNLIKQMLKEEDQNKSIPLHLAVEKGSRIIATMCIIRGSDVNKGTRYNTTPLHLAAMRGNQELVELLIKHGADVDARELDQSTPLHKAATHNHTSVAEYLLTKGAHIECHDEEDFTPLLIAASNGHVSMIQTLLARGAQVAVMDKEDRTPIFWAAQENQIEALKCLVEHVGGKKEFMYLLDAPNLTKDSPLHVAAEKGFLEVLKFLLEKKASLDSANERGQTPLHSAAKHGQIQIIREILNEHDESGAALSAKDDMLNSVLHIAALCGQLHAVDFLLERGADSEARNVECKTPLHFAAMKGHAEVCRALLLAYAQIDPKDDKEMTPYHRACAKGHIDAVKVFLEFNTPVKKMDANGDTGLDLAILRGHGDVAIAIINSPHGFDALRTASEQAVSKRTPFVTKLFGHVRCSSYRRTPIRLLIEKMPDVAVIALNKCITLNKQPGYERRNEDPYDQITVDFELLDDTYSSHWDVDSVDLDEDVVASDNMETTASRGDVEASDNMETTTSRGADKYDRCGEDGLPKSRDKPYHQNKHIVHSNHPLNMETTASRGADKYDRCGEDGLRKSRDKPYHQNKHIVHSNHPLIWIAKGEKEELLTHPVVELLVEERWRLSTMIYLILLFYHGAFLAVLTYFIITSTAPYSYVEERRQFVNSSINESFCRFLQLELGVQQAQGRQVAQMFIWVLGLMFALGEVWQLRLSRLKKGRSISRSIFTWIKLISALLLTIDVSHCHEVTGLKMDWQWRAGAVAIFMTYSEFVLRLTKHPKFGIQIIMFTDVMCSFLKFFAFFGWLVATFAITFCVLLENQYPFRNFWYSTVKTLVMMVGELDFENIFHSMEDPQHPETAKHRERLYYDIITYFLFVIFCIFMCLITMNLLVGLAVGDIDRIQKRAEIKKAAMRAEMAVSLILMPSIKRVDLMLKDRRRATYTAKNDFYIASVTKTRVKEVLRIAVEMHTRSVSSRLERVENMLTNISSTQNSLNPRLAEMEAHTQGLSGHFRRVESMLAAALSAQNVAGQPEHAP